MGVTSAVVADLLLARADGYLPRENWGERIRRRWPLTQTCVAHSLPTPVVRGWDDTTLRNRGLHCTRAELEGALTELARSLEYRDVRTGAWQDWGTCKEDWL